MFGNVKTVSSSSDDIKVTETKQENSKDEVDYRERWRLQRERQRVKPKFRGSTELRNRVEIKSVESTDEDSKGSKNVETEQRTNVDRTNDNVDYSSLEENKLKEVVKQYMISRGVRKSLIDVTELENKFGKKVVSKLVSEGYLLKTSKGVTIGI